MEKTQLKVMLAELYKDFWTEEEQMHGYEYNELSFSPGAFLHWLGKAAPSEGAMDQD